MSSENGEQPVVVSTDVNLLSPEEVRNLVQIGASSPDLETKQLALYLAKVAIGQRQLNALVSLLFECLRPQVKSEQAKRHGLLPDDTTTNGS